MNQRLYLLNQLRKQGLDIRGLTQIFMYLVVAGFHYALTAIAGYILVNDLNRINAVFAKAFKWQLTFMVPSAADRLDNADKKLFNSALNPNHCLRHMLPPKKMLTIDVNALKDMVEYYLWQKPNVIRTASSSSVYIAMLSSS